MNTHTQTSQVSLDLSGLPVVVSDTAGLRLHGDDEIEEEGMRRAARAWCDADVRVLVLDAAGDVAQVSCREMESTHTHIHMHIHIHTYACVV